MGQFPQFLETLPPGMDVSRVVDNERAAWLIGMKASHAVAFVCEHVCVSKMTQVVRTLPEVDDMGESDDELRQTWRVARHWVGVVQHYTDSAQAVHLQKVGQCFKARLFFESKCGKIPIKNQYLVLRPAQNRVAGLAILGFTGD